MKIIHELEEEFSSRRLAKESLAIRVRSMEVEYLLDELESGSDFLLGRSGRTVYFFPLQAITEVIGLEAKQTIDESLGDLLGRQKQPVKLKFADGAQLNTAWLLNIEGNWMRIASQQGVIWVPLIRLIIAQSELFTAGEQN